MNQYTPEFFESINKIEQLAKDRYGNDFAHALWGSAQCFLTDENLKVMENVFGRKEI